MSDEIVRLVIGLIWPLVVLLIAFLYRRELGALLEGATGLLRGGVSKLSLPGGISLELAKSTEFKIEWSGPDGQDLRNMVVMPQFASGAPDILGLLHPQPSSLSADYAVFDLGSGDKWLTSRLYLFSMLLRRMYGLRYCVFVYDTPDVRGRSLGFATTEVVRWALARVYPHLERAQLCALLGLSDVRITSYTGALDQQTASTFVNAYLARIQVRLLLSTEDLVQDVKGFAKNLLEGQGLSAYLRSQLPAPVLKDLAAGPQWPQQLQTVAAALNTLIQEQTLYEEARFSAVQLSDKTRRMLCLMPQGDDRTLLNRCLLREAYPTFVAEVPATALPPDDMPPHRFLSF
jgi:hypothetical protein